MEAMPSALLAEGTAIHIMLSSKRRQSSHAGDFVEQSGHVTSAKSR